MAGALSEAAQGEVQQRLADLGWTDINVIPQSDGTTRVLASTEEGRRRYDRIGNEDDADAWVLAFERWRRFEA